MADEKDDQSSTHSFDIIDHPTERDNTLEHLDDDPEVLEILHDPSLNEPEKISAIAHARGNFSGDTTVIDAYLAGVIDVGTAVDQLAHPIDEAYTTANHGRKLYQAELTARNQRQHWPADKAEELWGVREDFAPPEEGVEELITAEGGLWELWYGVLHAAKQIDWSDAVGQERLVDLVRWFKARPDPRPPQRMTVALKRDWIWSDGAVWSVLGMLGPSAREVWNDGCGCGSGWTIPEQHGWINVNAFVARITVAGLSNFSLYGKWALREALEDEIRGDVGHRKTDVVTKTSLLVMVACVWIRVAGKYMYENAAAAEQEEIVPSNLRGDELSWNKKMGDGRDAIDTNRWDFWRRRLLEEAGNEGLPDDVRSLAADCARNIASYQDSRGRSDVVEGTDASTTSRLLSDW